MTKRKKPIDKVTTQYLDIALRMCRIEIHYLIIDKIIDLVELLEEKGGQASVKDIAILQAEWKESADLDKKFAQNDQE